MGTQIGVDKSVISTPLPKPARRSLCSQVFQNREVYLFLLPTFLFLAVFTYYPIFSAFYHSFFNWDGFHKSFVGIQNFQYMFQLDTAFRASLTNIVKLASARILVAVVFPLLAAELIYNLRKAGSAYAWRVVFVIPMVVPWMVHILVWRFIYEPQLGILNTLLRSIGMDAWTQAWLGSPKFALWSLVFFQFPWVAGFNLLIFLAGLDSIPFELFDAAAIDGATRLRRILSLDIPMVLGQIKLVFVTTTINQIQNFQDVLVFTDGGPGQSTYVPGLVLYKSAFIYGKMGYASAIGLFLFVVIMLITLVNIKIIRSDIEYEP